MELDIAYYRNAYPTSYRAVCKRQYHTPTPCSLRASCCFVLLLTGGKAMLPQEYHEEACKLFYTWLRRLEERDRRNVTAKRSQPVQQSQQPPRFTEKTGEQDEASEELHHAYSATHLSSDEPDYTSPSGLSLPSLPSCE